MLRHLARIWRLAIGYRSEGRRQEEHLDGFMKGRAARGRAAIAGVFEAASGGASGKALPQTAWIWQTT